MRRGSRQRTSALEYDWTDVKWKTRRRSRMTRRPGEGKSIKRALGKKRRREPIDRDADDE